MARLLGLAILMAVACTSAAEAAFPVYNNTPHQISVCVATRQGGGTVLSIDASSSYTEPYRVWVNGWYRIEGYGGFATVPHGTHILILGPGNKRQATEPKQGMEGFPIKKNWAVITFKQSFNSDPWANTWETWRRIVQNDQSLEMRLFVPISYFRDGGGNYRLTMQKLGW